jgi:cysteine desulfuration protein SufE
MKETLKERSDYWIQEFSRLSTWEDRYQKIIALGKSLAALPEEMQTEEAKVKGCQSQVWLHAELQDGKILLRGDSDALLVRGLVALVLDIYSGATPTEILTTPPDFLKAMGFEGNLSPSRANGLFSMIKQIRYFAMAFATLK